MIETFQLAIIGAGPAGIEAAINASKAGVKTVLIDNYPQPGGQYFKQMPEEYQVSKDTPTEVEGKKLLQKLKFCNVTHQYNALVWAIFKEESKNCWLVALYGNDCPKYVRSKYLILANGAYDTPVAFPGWTLPGVITCGAALIQLKTQRFASGHRALISGTGPLLLSAAAHLIDAGVDVVAVCESSKLFPKGLRHAFTMLGHWHRLSEGAKYMAKMISSKTPYKTGYSIIEARGTENVTTAVISKIDDHGVPIEGTEEEIIVDLVVSGYNLTPNTGLARMIDCEMQYHAGKGGWVPVRDDTMQSSIPGVYIVGDGAGIGGAENARLEGQISATAIAFETGNISKHEVDNVYKKIRPQLNNQKRFGKLLVDLYSPKPGLINLVSDDTVICRCEEITFGEIKTAVIRGARTIGEVKMITRVGMGNCQGRMCEHSVTGAIIQSLADDYVSHQSIGKYSVRPPLHPIPQSYLANAGIEED